MVTTKKISQRCTSVRSQFKKAHACTTWCPIDQTTSIPKNGTIWVVAVQLRRSGFCSRLPSSHESTQETVIVFGTAPPSHPGWGRLGDRQSQQGGFAAGIYAAANFPIRYKRLRLAYRGILHSMIDQSLIYVSYDLTITRLGFCLRDYLTKISVFFQGIAWSKHDLDYMKIHFLKFL